MLAGAPAECDCELCRPEPKVLAVLSSPPGVLNPDLPRGPALGFMLMLLYLAFNRLGGPASAVSLPVPLPLCMLNMLRIRDPARADRLASGGCMNTCGSEAVLFSSAASASLSASSAAHAGRAHGSVQHTYTCLDCIMAVHDVTLVSITHVWKASHTCRSWGPSSSDYQ